LFVCFAREKVSEGVMDRAHDKGDCTKKQAEAKCKQKRVKGEKESGGE